MSLIYFKINSENVVTEAEYFDVNNIEQSTFPDEKFLTDGNRPLAEEDYDTVPVNTWIDTDTVLLEQRNSPVVNDINGCVYDHSSKTFSSE